MAPVAPLRDFLCPSPIRTRIAGVGGVDSNYLVQMCPGVTSHLHPDYPAMMVFIEYLTALEVSLKILYVFLLYVLYVHFHF